jgi:hypothetical protein
VVLLVLLLAISGFVIWAENPLGPMPEALAALETDSAVRVETDPRFTFWSQDQMPTSGAIIYPDGQLDPRSYAPKVRALAEKGHLAVITPMPLNLTVFDSGAAAAHPGMSLLWAITALSKTVAIVLWILPKARQRRNRVAMDSNGTMAYCLYKPAVFSANCQRDIPKACLALNRAVSSATRSHQDAFWSQFSCSLWNTG